MDIIKTKGVGLEVLDTDKMIDGEVAWQIAELIVAAEGDVQMAKGKFWNLCKRGDREEICDKMQGRGLSGWSYDNMKHYGRYATALEKGGIPPISFTIWDAVRRAVKGDEQRKHWSQKALENEWSGAELKRQVEAARLEGRAETLSEKSGKSIEEARRKVELDERKAEAEKSAKAYRKKYESAKKVVKDYESLKLETAEGHSGSAEAEEALKVLFRLAIKHVHTDLNGNENNAETVKVNAAKESLEGFIKFWK